MKTVIHLVTNRVYGQKEDMTPKVERTTVKLEDGDNFNKFVKHMHLKGFMKNKPPYVDKVLQLKGTSYQEIDKTKWQAIVDKALETKGVELKIDYKAEYEKQKAQNSDILDRLAALEGNSKSDYRIELESKAKELSVTFRANTGDEKLADKIKIAEQNN